MAHFYPGVPIAEIDEQQLAGYLQHVPACARLQSSGIASILASLLKK